MRRVIRDVLELFGSGFAADRFDLFFGKYRLAGINLSYRVNFG